MVSEDAHRGQLLAWQALQKNWQEEAEFRPITQITPPQIVLEFIDSQPGLSEVCAKFPGYLLDYAPQLAIRGFGGKWDKVFDEMLTNSVAESLARREQNSNFGTGTTTNKQTPECEDNLALRHPTFGNYQPAHVACGFVQGNGAGLGPLVRAFDIFDYLIWLLSNQSKWLPEKHRSYLLEGMKEWGVWMQYGRQPENEAFKPIVETGKFSEQLYGALEDGSWKKFSLTNESRADLRNQISAACELLNLPESPDELVQKFLKTDCITRWFDLPWQRRQRREKSARKPEKSKMKAAGGRLAKPRTTSKPK